MQSYKYELFENDHINNTKRDLLLSNVTYLKNKHHNLARAIYSLNNCLNYSLNIQDQNIDILSNKDYSFSDYKCSSSSGILDEEINKGINLEELDFLKENKNINNGNVINIINSSKRNSKNKNNREKYFSVIYPKKNLLSKEANLEKDSLSNKNNYEKRNSKNIKKEVKQKRRRNRRDMIRRMISRSFLNKYIVNKLNIILKRIKSKIYFEKFEKNFAYDFSKKENKKFLNKTLDEIFTSIELYRGKKLNKFHHNMKEIEKLKSDEYKDIIKEEKINIILNSQICILYKEYLSSNDFQKEIARIENSKKNYEEEYIKKYKNEATNFIEYSKE